MAKYEYRHRETYKDKVIDVKAHSQRELVKKAGEKKKEIDRGLQKDSDADTVKKWSEQWLSTYVKGSVSDYTYKDIESRLNNKIIPIIGHMKLIDVKPLHCKAVMDTMAGYSLDRVNKVYNTMFQMFSKAQKNWLIDRNPADDVAKPSAVNGRGRALYPKEVEVLRDVCKTHEYGDWALTMIESGARPGETYTMRWCHLKDGSLFIDGTKTKNAKRTVPLPDDLNKKLESKRGKPFGYIFTQESGKPLNKSSSADAWQSILRAMQIKAGTKVQESTEVKEGTKVKEGILLEPYVLDNTIKAKFCRHTYATMLKDAALPYTILQELLGHATGSITDNYLHATESGLQLAARLLKEHREKEKVSHDVSHSNSI